MKGVLMAPTIQSLALRMAVGKGLDYYNAKKTLELHMKGLDIIQFAAEVDRIKDRRAFPQLWAIGLSRSQQTIVSDAWGRLIDAS